MFMIHVSYIHILNWNIKNIMPNQYHQKYNLKNATYMNAQHYVFCLCIPFFVHLVST